jgi:ADP-ribose pyrophosphatase YjhB (NUDIX family)
MTIGVRAIVWDASDSVLLVRHEYMDGWHLPGGGVERGETIFDAVTRELREEARIQAIGPIRLRSVHANGSNHIAVFDVTKWQLLSEAISFDVAEAQWFDARVLPPGTTAGTAARLHEMLSGGAPASRW